MKSVSIIGVGNSWMEKNGGGNGSQDLLKSQVLQLLEEHGVDAQWVANVFSILPETGADSVLDETERSLVQDMNSRLGNLLKKELVEGKLPLILGEARITSLGTWPALCPKNIEGLIWLDNRLSLEIPTQSIPKRLCQKVITNLLGQGTFLKGQTFKPENICLIGGQTFLEEEKQAAEASGIQTILLEEVNRKGLSRALEKAHKIASRGQGDFGISIGLNAFDIFEAPGVFFPGESGISFYDLEKPLRKIARDPRLCAIEVLGYDFSQDQSQKTLQLLKKILVVLLSQKL